MLSLLHIENIAVIEQADISFDKGFNVLTGETGAGKSIVIDAISAILGQRAYRDMIRTGTSKASVRAVFTKVPNFPWFEENGVEYDEETVIQRDIFLDGKNVCRVGSRPALTCIFTRPPPMEPIHRRLWSRLRRERAFRSSPSPITTPCAAFPRRLRPEKSTVCA